MIDLDNTLIDRDAAFRSAVMVLLEEHDVPAVDADWIMAADASGFAPRGRVAAAIVRRYAPAIPDRAVRMLIDRGGCDHVVLEAGTRRALGRASANGWSLVIVTNGMQEQQEAKIRAVGLDHIVDGWVISESAGHRKPQREIFAAAAAAVGASLEGAWMIGDAPHTDILGANAIGVRSVWLASGRSWPETTYRPTFIADDVVSAIEHVLLAGESG